MVKTKRNLLLIILSVVFALTLISFVAAKPVNAEASVITMKETASVRIDPDGRNGIRFTGYVGYDVELDEDTFAGIIVAKGDVEAPVVTDDVIDVKAERFDEVNNSGAGRAFNAVIWDIPQVAYAQDLTARAYICDNGVYTYSDNVLTRSLAEVASKVIIADNPVGEDLTTLEGYIDGAKPVLSIGETTLLEDGTNEITIVAGETATIAVAPAKIAFEVYADANSKSISISDNVITATAFDTNVQTIMIDIGSKTYVVDITIEKWVDTNLATNVLFDFDEAEYIYAVQKGDNSGEGTNTNFTVSNGVLNVSAANYSVTKFNFEPVRLGDTNGIYVKVKYPTTHQWGVGSYSMTMHVNNSSAIYIAPTILSSFSVKDNTGDFFYLGLLATDLITKFGFTADTMVSSIDFMPIGLACEFAVDEIGILAKPAKTETLVSFNTKADNVYYRSRWSFANKVILPGESDYPADKGATGGVLAITGNEHGLPQHITFAQSVETAKVSKIVVRMYIPNDKTSTLVLQTNQKSVYADGAWAMETDHWAANVNCASGFVDVVMDLEGSESWMLNSLSSTIHSIAMYKRDHTFNTTWYIESISVVYKAEV